MPSVGFSTGSFYRINIPLEEKVSLCKRSGSTAIELSFSSPKELFGFKASAQMAEYLKSFSYLSVHAPWKDFRYGNDSCTKKVLARLKRLHERLDVKGFVLHPGKVDDFKIIAKSGIPFALENSDSRKYSWSKPEHFRCVAQDYALGFVLDIQHVYEHDKSMQLASEFIEFFGQRLRHMHVSGCNSSEIHFPTYLSSNRKEISQVLRKSVKVPKILEGVLSGNIEKITYEEICFVKRFEE